MMKPVEPVKSNGKKNIQNLEYSQNFDFFSCIVNILFNTYQVTSFEISQLIW